MGLGGRGTAQARESLVADRERAGRLDDLLREVAAAQAALEEARESGAAVEELHERALALDTALTEAMRAAYARERVLVGEKGYRDRIHRRKRLARPAVREATEVAEQLLTAREAHRLHGVPRVPRTVGAL
ncbi:hypothetical protein ACOQFV_29970 [Nocardiopsis changdeensis]|uniref:Uncharacterized protein n=1 Tax=Nocardiopsis changdeensis TaxID=2831969 RepID=A0ABX8BUS4_9ACTN|nr:MULTISPECIES: hypothetical protein [Nocardiopsis]QUX24959.1 hypothetical protein KGD84_12235 [Nocardiopsis changdeensis]QYX35345.1 hypothetical protein K1J57_21680 [Nocardiopsis sp. MT53]